MPEDKLATSLIEPRLSGRITLPLHNDFLHNLAKQILKVEQLSTFEGICGY